MVNLVIVEEADESVYWLDLMVRTKISGVEVPALRDEAGQLRAIFSRSIGTARANLRAHYAKPPKSPNPMTR